MNNSHRSKIKRIPSRGSYDRSVINQIIDEALYCHVSFVLNDQPFTIPTIHARIKHEIILHGAKGSRMLKHIIEGNEICISITLMDGLVLARSVFHHSMNYRSVVVFGKGRELIEREEKLEALKAITNRLINGRWEDARQPNEKELNVTSIVAIKMDEASAKIRTGPAVDDEEDLDLPVWAGVIPIMQKFHTPENDSKLGKNIVLPDYIREKINK